jgi:DNA-binding HxlR family transcriptional regulator
VTGRLRYFRQKATIAFNVGRGRRIQMSDNDTSVWRILGKKWTLPILEIISSKESVRFCEIKRLLSISSTMLSERLLELEREGLVAKRIHYSRIEYSLTAGARELESILAELDRWWPLRRLAIAVSVE